MSLDRKYLKWLWCVFALALALRYAAAFKLPQQIIPSWESDGFVYQQIAVNLNQTHTYGREAGVPDAQDPPLYPFFLSLLYHIAEPLDAILLVRLIQGLLAAVGVFLVFSLSLKIFNAWGAALAAAVLYAIYPPLVLYPNMHLTESIYILVLLCFAWSYVRSLELKPWAIILTGILWGLTILNRETLELFIFLLPLPLFLRKYTWRQVGRYMLLFLAGAFLVLSPWIIRNYLSLHRLILVTAGSGPVLYVSNYIPPDGLWTMDGDRLAALFYQLQPNQEVNYTFKAAQEIAHNIFYRPGAYLDMVGKKFWELWLHPSGSYQIHQALLKWIYLGAHYLLIILAGWAGVKGWREKNSEIFSLALILLYLTCLHVLMLFPQARYMVPFWPLVLILGSGAVAGKIRVQEKSE